MYPLILFKNSFQRDEYFKILSCECIFLGYQINCINFKPHYSLIKTLFVKSEKRERGENENKKTKKERKI